MSVPAGSVPQPAGDVGRPARLGDLFVFAPPPPRPDADEPLATDAFFPFDDPFEYDGPIAERVTAAVKLAAVVVVAGLGGGFAMWAFGSAAVRVLTGLAP